LNAGVPAAPDFRKAKGKDAMASPSTFQQHLSPADMMMLDRVLRKVCISNSIGRDSADAECVAALLIQQFQQGANTEGSLMTVFDVDGDFALRVPATRLSA